MSTLYYQSEVVQIQPTGANPTAYIPMLQSAGISFNVNRTTNSSLGKFGPSKYRQANQWPVVNFNVEYIPTGSNVEEALGLMGPNSVVDHLVLGAGGYMMNDYRMQIKDLDSNGANGERGTYNLKSGVLTNYSFQAAVGQTPKASFSIECLDMGFDADEVFYEPPVDEDLAILRPQDMDVTLPTGIVGVGDAHLQSFNITIPLSRKSAYKIGSAKPVRRDVNSPVIATIQMNALLEEVSSSENVNGDSLDFKQLVQGKPMDDDIIIKAKVPTQDGSDGGDIITYSVSSPYLDNYNISNSVGGYTSVDLQFSVPVTFERGSGDGNLTIY